MMNKIYSMLGLCMKAGKLAYGNDMCAEKLKYNKVKLIILTEDASDNTKERFRKMCKENVRCIIIGNSAELNKAIGKENKVVVAVMDDAFSDKIIELVEERLKGANN